MGTMSASDAVPLPRLGEVFFDVRGDSRTLRLSWYADTGVAVLSIWQGGMCTGTFRLAIADLPRMVETLQRGPGRPAPSQPDDHRTRPAQYPAGPAQYPAGPVGHPAEAADLHGVGYLRPEPGVPAESTEQWEPYRSGPETYRTEPAQYPAEPAPYPPEPAQYPPEPVPYPPEPAPYPPGTAQYPPGTAGYPRGPAGYPPEPAGYPAEYPRAPAPADYQDEMRPGQYPAGTSAPRPGEDLDRTTADYPQHYDAVAYDPGVAYDDLPEESLPYGSPSVNRVAPSWPARPGVPFG
jgi:hypothetical protein